MEQYEFRQKIQEEIDKVKEESKNMEKEFKTIKELEAELNSANMNNYRNGKIQALKDIVELIVTAYKKCKDCYELAKRNNLRNKEERLNNFSGRIDELTLLYSEIKGCNFNEAKEELIKRIEG